MSQSSDEEDEDDPGQAIHLYRDLMEQWDSTQHEGQKAVIRDALQRLRAN
jgi:hypothetical protein